VRPDFVLLEQRGRTRRPGRLAIALLAISCGGREAGPPDAPSAPSSLTAPVTAPAPAPTAKTSSIPFDLVGQGWIRVPARVSDGHGRGEAIRMMFDTGGGVTLFSKSLCDRVGCVPDGTFTGKRMSGQALTLPMARVPSIDLGGDHLTNARVAVLPTTEFLSPELGIQAAGALDLLRDQPFTLDYAASRLVLEDERSLAARRAAGESVSVRVEDDGPSTVVYLPLELATGGPPLSMEVDTGSLHLILDARRMRVLGIDPADPTLRRVEGDDQSGAHYVRYYGKLPGEATVPGTSNVRAPAGTTVMFQTIIHDGLVGHQFLSGHSVTFDLPHAAMIFAPRG
jgi:hypothetical protein